mmetsp:Transcript_16297/g.42927  ORF Transcript_16297/g.42927 Transcript_16297/m.42927 type:complete len:325 (-) Transcript_16297:33-1007(-)
MRLLLTCLACAAALVPPTQPRQCLTVAHNVASANVDTRSTKYVDQLLDVVSKTDRGVRAKEATRNIIDGLIARLERSYKGADASETPEWLYRDSEVVYVGQRSSKRANAAGGRFRGRVGRLLFRTTALYQHIQRDGESLRAVNANRFRFLGSLPGCAVLRGSAEKENDLEALSAKFDRTLSENTLRASFERPKIAFGPLVFEAGPASVVRLDTTYLDDRVRISRGGSSGTPFVFRACAADDARKDAWKRVAEATPVSAKTAGVGVGVLAAVAAGTAARIGTKNVAFAPAVVLALASAKLLTSTGGIVVTRDPAKASYKNAGQGG